MSEQLPPQDSDPRQYARPNDHWECGYAAEGKPCRLGPDRRGNCRATAECLPILEKKEGESKGRWRCTRGGGACSEGPLPDGRCGRQLIKCSPRPTLRCWRGRITLAVVAASLGCLLIFVGGFWRGGFLNRGPLSLAHSGEAFHYAFAGTNKNVHETCGACHKAGAGGLGGILSAAWHADPAPLEFNKLTEGTSGKMTAIDASCQKCHVQHLRHRDELAVGLSCSNCHEEHRGPGRMALPNDDRCATCHADADDLAESRERTMLAGFIPSAPGRAVASSFEWRHPEFRVQALHLRDTNTLRFNHSLHLTSPTVTKLSAGRAVDCVQCHRQDASGEYVRGVNFNQNCQECHSLQFDAETPELHLPHGQPGFVSAFLRTLPKQYADLAARAGTSDPVEQNRFAQARARRLLEQFSSGEELEKRIFFSNSTLGPQRRVGTVEGSTPALYSGCAYCHEVNADSLGKPRVTKPIMTERWLSHGGFNHAKHVTTACVQCHDAVQSRETSDVIIPTKRSCAKCHSGEGGVVDSCITCHNFHTKSNEAVASASNLSKSTN